MRIDARAALAAAVALASAGCGGDGKGDDQGGPTGPAGPGIADLTAAPLAGMPTVIEVTWTTSEPTTGRVVFGLGAGAAPDRATLEQAEGTEHRALLVGLPPGEVVTLAVELADGGSDPLEVTTGDLPLPAPGLAVEGGGNDHFTLLAAMEEARARIVLLDPEGRVTWIHEDTRGLSVFRARLAHDHSGIVYLSSIVRGGPSPDSVLVRVAWDGTETEVIPIPDAAHDFVEREDGTLVVLAYEERDGVLGNTLVAVPPSGAPETFWTAWDCYDPDLHVSDDPQHGWTHTNALDWDPIDGVYLVGMRNLNGIGAVEEDGSGCRWTFGGAAGDVAIEGERFAHQHQFERIDGGLLVFDNEGAPGQVSRVVEYAFDPAAKTASATTILRADPDLVSLILGDVHRTDDGGTLVVWSIPGKLDRMDADGARTFRVETTEPGVLYGFAQWTTDPYVVPP